MLLRYAQESPARMRAVGGLFLALALTLMLFVHPSAKFPSKLVDGLSGLFLGLSIALNLFAARCVARPPRNGC